MNPRNCRYTKSHTWVRVENSLAYIGITDYAQQQLGAVLFLEMVKPGEAITQFKPCGTVESDKATSDIMCPISGKALEVNEEVLNAPEIVNQDPYGKGWLIKASLANHQELKNLMTAEEFEAYTGSG